MNLLCPRVKGYNWERCLEKGCKYRIPSAKYGNCELVAMENAPLTLREIAEIMGVSPERVRQIQESALRKFRDVLMVGWIP